MRGEILALFLSNPAHLNSLGLSTTKTKVTIVESCDYFDLPLISLFLFFPYLISSCRSLYALIFACILLLISYHFGLFCMLSNCSHVEHMLPIASTWLLQSFSYFIPVFQFSIIPVHVIVVLGYIYGPVLSWSPPVQFSDCWTPVHCPCCSNKL
jgi:hypothetical protein